MTPQQQSWNLIPRLPGSFCMTRPGQGGCCTGSVPQGVQTSNLWLNKESEPCVAVLRVGVCLQGAPGLPRRLKGGPGPSWLQPDTSALGVGLPRKLSFDGFCGLEEERGLETVACRDSSSKRWGNPTGSMLTWQPFPGPCCVAVLYRALGVTKTGPAPRELRDATTAV